MTQTAVTFLAGKIAELNTLHINNRIDLNQFQLLFNEAYQQAKEMEKQQIINAFNDGRKWNNSWTGQTYNKELFENPNTLGR